MNIEEAFAMAEDKGRLSARDFLDKMRTDYEWHVISGGMLMEPMELYVKEPEGWCHYLPPYFIEMPIEEVQAFFEEFNTISSPGSNRFMPKITKPKDTDGGTSTPDT